MNGLVSFGLCTLTDEELIEKVDSLTDEMYEKGKLHSRHIPARPNADYDLLVGELLIRFKNTLSNETKELDEMIQVSKRVVNNLVKLHSVLEKLEDLR